MRAFLVSVFTLALAAIAVSADADTKVFAGSVDLSTKNKPREVPLAMPPMKLAGTRDEIMQALQPTTRYTGRQLAEMMARAQADSPALGASVTGTVMLHESLFKKVIADALPVVIAGVKALSIPGEKSKHFSFDDIHVSEFGIGSFTIGFEAPNKIVIDLENLSMAVPDTHFDVYAKALFVHLKCGGEFDVSMSGTNIRVSFALTDSNGRLAFADGTASVSFGHLDVHHRFDSFICRVGQDVVQIFIGSIDKLITKLVEEKLPPIASKAIDGILASLSSKVTLHLAAAPVATSDSISITVDLELGAEERAQQLKKLQASLGVEAAVLPAVPAAGRAVSDAALFPTRDVEVFVPVATINTLLAHYQSEGKLNIHDHINANTSIFRAALPAAYDACPGCPLEVGATWHTAPAFIMNHNAVTLYFHTMSLGIFGIRGTALVPIFDVNINGTFTLNNWTISGSQSNTIDFKLAMPEIVMSLEHSSIGPVDLKLVDGVLDFLLRDVIVPDFNSKFHGLPISPIAGVGLVDLEFFFNNAMDIGFNINLPPLA